MKNFISFAGCFLIGFFSSSLGIPMFASIGNFLLVMVIVVVWGFLWEFIAEKLNIK